MLRRMIFNVGLVVLAMGLNGCGDSVPEGVPSDVDMTKDYSPKIALPGIDQKASVKAAKKAAADAKKNPAPVADPAPAK